MSNDDLDHIPSIIPSRDREPHHPGGNTQPRATRPAPKAGRGAKRGGSGGGSARPPSSGGGGGLLTRLLVVVALAVAGVACGWAFQLQEQLKQADVQMADYASRISDLEDRLSDTDEGMSQNAAVQAAKLRELDSEVRKLWDNVWKKSKERLAKLEASSKSQGSKVAATEKSVASLQSKVKSAEGDLAKLKSVAGDLERLMASARTNQEEVERVADALNRINLDLAKMSKKVQANDEAMRSVDTFRRQTNTSINELQAAIRALQAAP